MKTTIHVSRVVWVGVVLAALTATRAVAQDGAIVGWGGQVVVPPSALTDLVAVAAGAGHSLGLKADGSVVAWGNNSEGECNVPAPNSGFIAVAGGYEHSLGLKADGAANAQQSLNDGGA